MRFDRNYRLTIGTGNRAVVVKPPMRCVFVIDKAIKGATKATKKTGLNKAAIAVYNLKESNRLAVVKDDESEDYLPIRLEVGFNGTMQTVFRGDVTRGVNRRNGADFESYFDCLDGGRDFRFSFTSRTVRDKATAVNEILRDTPNTTRGKITEQSPVTRPKVLVGNSFQLIEESLDPGDSWYIDNEQLYIIKGDEVVSGYVPVVTARTGLLNTPERQKEGVSFQTILNPGIKLGGQVELRSVNAPHLNDVYKVIAISYTGDYDGNNPYTQTVTGQVVPGVKVLRG